jgi:hypothetical protein
MLATLFLLLATCHASILDRVHANWFAPLVEVPESLSAKQKATFKTAFDDLMAETFELKLKPWLSQLPDEHIEFTETMRNHLYRIINMCVYNKLIASFDVPPAGIPVDGINHRCGELIDEFLGLFGIQGRERVIGEFADGRRLFKAFTNVPSITTIVQNLKEKESDEKLEGLPCSPLDTIEICYDKMMQDHHTWDIE